MDAMVSIVALSQLLGAPVRDADARTVGRLRDVAIVPAENAARLHAINIRVGGEDRVIPASVLLSITGGVVTLENGSESRAIPPPDGALWLKRDLLDQQIIDVHGRKVVRVNDVEIDATPSDGHVILTLRAVDVGARGAVRRLGQGLVPGHTLRALLARIPTRVIPWAFVDLLESDPARRVKLKIAYEGLSTLHPADIADIIEDLAPAEREGVFETLDEQVAAETLEELEHRVKVAVVESLDSDRAADIVEEMDPDAAADLLGDLPEHQSGAILQEMQPEERQQVRHLLAFGEHTAAGRMTTEFLAVPADSTLPIVIDALRRFEGGMESLATIYLVSPGGELVGGVPLAKAVVAGPETPLADLALEQLVSCHADTPEDQVAELFDKYNLLTLPVVDEHGRLAGIITADDVISLLRSDD
jgi:magnesium transporter